MYAIVRSGGHQYRVEVGRYIDVERLSAEEGEKITFDEVLLIAPDNGAPQVGQPLVSGASVSASVVSQYRAKKIYVWKYKPKKRYRLSRGHRQYYTRVMIDAINA